VPGATPEVNSAVGRLRVTRRHHGLDHPDTRAAERDLAAAKLAAHIARVVDAAPPLTPEQRDRLAALLRPGRRAS